MAFAIHLLTASGAALALLALFAAGQAQWSLMFLWLGAALAVDAIDGPLARRLDVRRLQPRWDGNVLDLVIDFATYVMVPAYAIVSSGLMPEPIAIACGCAIVVCGALYFADRQMKTVDNYFRGFPAVWNVVAFYLLLLQPPAPVAFATIAAFAVLTFAPVRFVHPVRVRRWRPLTLALLAAWAALALSAVLQDLAPGNWETVALCVIGLYFLFAGLMLPGARKL